MADTSSAESNLQGAIYFTEKGAGLAEAGEAEKASKAFEKAIALDPSAQEPVCRLAGLRVMTGDLESAINVLKAGCAEHSDWGEARFMLGKLYEDLGKFDEALAAYHEVLALQPQNIDVMLRIVVSRKITAEDSGLVDTLERLSRHPELPEVAAVRLHKTLAKAYDDLKEHQRALMHADLSRDLAKQVPGGYWIPSRDEIIDEWLETSKESYSAGFFEQVKPEGLQTEKPILIVGMLRSGTTLLDQLLSSHPQVASAGETIYWSSHTKKCETALLARAFEEAREIAKGYEDLLEEAGPGCEKVIDKAPLNFVYLGVLHSMFPNARIIHMKRHPVDTCISLYLTPQVWISPLGRDRNSIVRFYKSYQRFMDFWKQELPKDRYMEVQYEELVAHKEPVLRKVLEFCGLKWDDACLRHEQNERVVKTPSRWQVRQPVYQSSVARWRNYAPWLGPFADLLTPEEKAEI